MIIRPSKKILFTAIVASLVLHAFVCRIPVQSALPEEKVTQKLNISLLSLAAPKVTESVKKVEKKQVEKKVEKPVKKIVKKAPAPKKIVRKEIKEVQKIERKQVKKQIRKPVKRQITSNNKGTQRSTVTPVLSPMDFVKTVIPVYPRRAVDRGIQGKVLVKVRVNNSGNAESVNVASSSGFSALDNSAVKAVSKWKFKTSALSKSFQNWVLVPVEFIIQ